MADEWIDIQEEEYWQNEIIITDLITEGKLIKTRLELGEGNKEYLENQKKTNEDIINYLIQEKKKKYKPEDIEKWNKKKEEEKKNRMLEGLKVVNMDDAKERIKAYTELLKNIPQEERVMYGGKRMTRKSRKKGGIRMGWRRGKSGPEEQCTIRDFGSDCDRDHICELSDDYADFPTCEKRYLYKGDLCDPEGLDGKSCKSPLKCPYGIGVCEGDAPTYEEQKEKTKNKTLDFAKGFAFRNIGDTWEKRKKRERKTVYVRRGGKKLMCPKACCGAPVMKCGCPKTCPHCNCHEIQRLRKKTCKKNKRRKKYTKKKRRKRRRKPRRTRRRRRN